MGQPQSGCTGIDGGLFCRLTHRPGVCPVATLAARAPFAVVLSVLSAGSLHKCPRPRGPGGVLGGVPCAHSLPRNGLRPVPVPRKSDVTAKCFLNNQGT